MTKWLPGLYAAVGLLALASWLAAGPAVPIAVRAPAPSAAAGPAAGDGSPIQRMPDGRRVPGAGLPAPELAGEWPGFRGPRRDGIGREPVALARAWAGGAPQRLWQVEVGEGYAGVAVGAGRVYVHDYDAARREEAIRCLSLADGREIWRWACPETVKRNHGMTRTVPAIAGGRLLALSPKCRVTCLEAESGRPLWRKDLAGEFGATVPPWYAGQCPLFDGERAVLAPGGPDTLLFAADAATGDLRWRTPNPHAWAMTHASLVTMDLLGRSTYVVCGSGGVAGVAADTGELLWETDAWKIRIATVPTPLVVGPDRLFLAGGYDAGALMLRLRPEGTRYVPEVVFRLEARVFGATQQTPILHEGHIYGVRPDGEAVCLDLAGRVQWTSGREYRFGLGPFLAADGLLLLLGEEGRLTLADLDPRAFRPRARAQILPGPEAWAPLALAGGRLLARDLTRLACLDLTR